MQRITIQTVKGGIQVVTAGQISTTLVEGSFPSCTVSVFNTGTTNLTTIYGDNLNPPTLKSNPFTADANGFGFFYAANGSRVDVQLSGTGITTPFIVAGDILVDDPSFLIVSSPSVIPFSATPQFDLSQADWFQITLTGNVTGPTFPNATAGAILILTIAQDGAGGHTWAWPGSFLRPPAIASAASAVTELTFKFDGTNWRALAATGDNLQVSGNAAIAGNESLTGTLAIAGGTPLATTNQTGTGSLVLANSPTLITPVLGVATATSIAIGGGTALTTTNRTGTGNLVLATSPALATPTLTSPTVTNPSTTGTDSGVETLSNKTLTSPVLNGSLTGSAIHAQSFTGLSVSASTANDGQQFSTTLTLSSSMGDTGFMVVASIRTVSAGSPYVIGAIAASATTVTVTMANGSAVQSTVTAIDLICIHP